MGITRGNTVISSVICSDRTIIVILMHVTKELLPSEEWIPIVARISPKRTPYVQAATVLSVPFLHAKEI